MRSADSPPVNLPKSRMPSAAILNPSKPALPFSFGRLSPALPPISTTNPGSSSGMVTIMMSTEKKPALNPNKTLSSDGAKVSVICHDSPSW